MNTPDSRDLYDENAELRCRVEELEAENAKLRDRIAELEPKPRRPISFGTIDDSRRRR